MATFNEVLVLVKEINNLEPDAIVMDIDGWKLSLTRKGCATEIMDSPDIAMEALTHFKNFLISKEKREEVVSHVETIRGTLDISRGDITKISPTEWGTGSFSVGRFECDGYISVVLPEKSATKAIGISSEDRGGSYENIEYGCYLVGDNLKPMLNGADVGNSVNYAAGDTVEFERVGTDISIYKNDAVVHTFTNVSQLPMYIDTAFYTLEGKLFNLEIHQEPKYRL